MYTCLEAIWVYCAHNIWGNAKNIIFWEIKAGGFAVFLLFYFKIFSIYKDTLI